MTNSSNDALTAAVAKIRSEDVMAQNEGVAELIQIGATAVPVLLPLIDEVASIRAQAMYAISRIADPGTSEALKRGLQDNDDRVRAYAAEGLARIGHPDAVSACIRMINDAPDILHGDLTPCVTALAEMGLIAVPALLDLMMHEDEITRLHAQRALEMNLSRRHGFRGGLGFPSPAAEQQARAEWQANGNYDYAADAAARQAAVEKWRQWLSAQPR